MVAFQKRWPVSETLVRHSWPFQSVSILHNNSGIRATFTGLEMFCHKICYIFILENSSFECLWTKYLHFQFHEKPCTIYLIQMFEVSYNSHSLSLTQCELHLGFNRERIYQSFIKFRYDYVPISQLICAFRFFLWIYVLLGPMCFLMSFALLRCPYFEYVNTSLVHTNTLICYVFMYLSTPHIETSHMKCSSTMIDPFHYFMKRHFYIYKFLKYAIIDMLHSTWRQTQTSFRINST